MEPVWLPLSTLHWCTNTNYPSDGTDISPAAPTAIRDCRLLGHTPSLSAAELALEVAHERIDPDALDRLSVAMQGVELAAALGIADVLPVGSLVAGAGKARLLDEGFEQDRSIGVAVLPVVGQASAHHGKDARGEIFAVDPRQDQEAGIVHDEVQVALSLVCGPTDELVPGVDPSLTVGGHMEGCGRRRG